MKETEEKLAYPLFVKPVRVGSSLGITRITEKKELNAAIGIELYVCKEIKSSGIIVK